MMPPPKTGSASSPAASSQQLLPLPPDASTRGGDADLYDDSSDSDLELDLSELDPTTAPAAIPQRQPSDTSTSSRSASRLLSRLSPSRQAPEKGTDPPPTRGIALRNLRMSSGGGGARRKTSAGYGRLGHDRDGQDVEDGDEAAAGLLDDGEYGESSSSRRSRRRSRSNASHDDDAPLLSGRRSRPRRSFAGDRLQHFAQLSSQLRLPSFMSGRGDGGRSGNGEGVGDDGEDDGGHEDDEDDASASRMLAVGSTGYYGARRFPPNIVSNAKYTAWSFLPLTLYNEFSFFFNMYFLLVALSQIIPALRIGYLLTYIAPLAFVLTITLGKEAYDDIERRRRDNEANSEEYTVLSFEESGPSTSVRSRRKMKSASVRRGRKGSATAAPRDRLADIQEEEEQTEGRGARPSPITVYEISRKSRDLKVGDVLKLHKGQRVPADVVILKCLAGEHGHAPAAVDVTDEPSLLVETATDGAPGPSRNGKDKEVDEPQKVGGETFIRTDQLDGETDWKLRLASPLTQSLPTADFVRLRLTAGKPDKKVNEFVGTIELMPTREDALLQRESGESSTGDVANSAPLSIDNTAWASTVIASQATTLAVVVYTGPQTRSALSTSPSRSKNGLLEYEINSLTKILCALTLALSIVLVALEGFSNTTGSVWYVKIMRFLVLFSTIVPISLRVNLDLGKTVYSYFIQHDPGMPGAVVRTSTIPEDLGRIEYLLSDKTGTLTQNEMEMKKIHVGTVSYANDAMDEVTTYVRQGFHVPPTLDSDGAAAGVLVTPSTTYTATANMGATRTRREIGARVRDVVLALALCHNVTPTTDEDEDGKVVTSYQASSPDEIAIVRWTESVGLRLVHRDRKGMTLESTAEAGRPVVQVRILDTFPFTSDSKRMGIIVQFYENTASVGRRDLEQGEIWFYQKGADTVMGAIVATNDWLDEETANMAREGLRTLVVGRRRLSPAQYQEFAAAYQEASLAITGRDQGMQKVVAQHLEHDLELLGVTGVEDKLQRDVKPSLELLRNAGIKIWMLTGDKVETARCVAVSSRLVARGQHIYTVARLRRKDGAQEHLDFLRSKPDTCLLVDGESLALLLAHFATDFVAVAVQLPAVVACRCSPTQKAEVARLIRSHTRKRVCCIGDGGNDVSMIQAADVGVGIVGKEGRQASLAADFSITQFCHLTKLLVWHGRNSYKRSAKLAQFVIHRGLIIAVCQTMFSIAIRFEPEGLYRDWLLVGYATVYTAAPVLSLVLDRDVDESLASLYPELYRELTSGRSLSYRTFFVWVLISIYQGCLIQGLSQILTDVEGKKMVAVSYTVLILNELLMVAIEITTWHYVMVLSILGTFLIYVGSVPFLADYFDLAFILTW